MELLVTICGVTWSADANASLFDGLWWNIWHWLLVIWIRWKQSAGLFGRCELKLGWLQEFQGVVLPTGSTESLIGRCFILFKLALHAWSVALHDRNENVALQSVN